MKMLNLDVTHHLPKIAFWDIIKQYPVIAFFASLIILIIGIFIALDGVGSHSSSIYVRGDNWLKVILGVLLIFVGGAGSIILGRYIAK